MSKSITIEYPIPWRYYRPDGSSVMGTKIERKTFEATDLHCVACGVAQVYVELGCEDYYVGPQYLCAACAAAFTLQYYRTPNDTDKRDAELLRAAEVSP